MGGVVVATAGCSSSAPIPVGETPTPSARERCGDRRFPRRHLGVIALEESEQPDDASTVIRYQELPPSERAIVARAIERGRYAICLPESPDDGVERFTSLVERIGNHVRAGDVVFVTARS